MCCGVNAISAGTEIDPIEIDLEYLVLGEAVLEPEGQESFLNLAGKAPLRCQKQILGELLGNRAAALDETTGGDIGEQCPRKSDRIDPEMAVETAVLGRDHGLRHVGRHFLQSQGLPEEVAVSGEQTPVRRQYCDARAALGAGELARVWKGESEITDNSGPDDQDPQTQQDAELRASG